MKYKEVKMEWGTIYIREDDSMKMNYRAKMNDIVCHKKYGRGWDELYDYERKGITRIWFTNKRPILEKILGDWE